MELRIGRHSLQSFGMDFAKKLRFSGPIMHRRDDVVIEGVNGPVAVRSNFKGYKLVQLLRDQVQPDNLIAVRKESIGNPFGHFAMFTVHPSGREQLVGHIETRKLSGLAAEVAGLYFTPYLERGLQEDRLSYDHLSEDEILDGIVLRLSMGDFKNRIEDFPLKPQGSKSDSVKYYAAYDAFLKRESEFVQRQKGARKTIASYRNPRLERLLLAIAEETAKQGGIKKMRALAFKGSTGRIVHKIPLGWKITGETPFNVKVEKEL